MELDTDAQELTEELRSLLDLIDSDEPAVRDRAVLQLAMLLEMNFSPAIPAEDPYFYEEIVPEMLRRRPLREAEEAFIVDRLNSLLDVHHGEADGSRAVGLLWAMSRASPWIAIVPVLDFVRRSVRELSEPEILQALYALQRFLFLEADHSRFPEVCKAAATHDARHELQWIADSDWKDPRIAAEARRAIEMLASLPDL